MQFTMRYVLILSLAFSGVIYGQDRHIIGQELGVLEVKIETYKENIVLYNEDGSVWMQFDFDYENKLSNKINYTIDDIKKLYHWKEEFSPYAFHIDYALLMFKCTGIEGDKYKIVVNEAAGMEKYVKKEKLWIFRTWPDHIINSVASVDFDISANPVRAEPSETAAIQNNGSDIDPIVQPIEIRGDWLKIKYSVNETDRYGWIQWKKENLMLVSLYYLI